MFDVDFIGIWCELARQDFGHIRITDADRDNLPPFIPLSQETVSNFEIIIMIIIAIHNAHIFALRVLKVQNREKKRYGKEQKNLN